MGNQSDKNYQDEIIILNQFLAAQSVFHIFETADNIAVFSATAIRLVPGVNHCSFCLIQHKKPFGDLFDSSRKLADALSHTSEYKKDNTINLPDEKNLIIYSLQTPKFFFGYVLITLSDKDKFESYRPAVGNLINIVAINLENNLQNQQLKKNREELETEVKNRTAELREEVADHLRSQKALREGEKRYRDLFNINPNPMWIYDIKTLAFKEVNDAAVSQYGYSREEFLSMTIENIHLPEDDNKIQLVFRDNIILPLQVSEWRHIKKDGTIIDVEISTHHLPRRGKKSERLLHAKDVTIRKQIEGELLKSEQRFRELANNLPIGIFETNMNGDVVFSNDTAFEWFGYTEFDLLAGFNFFNCIIESERPRLLENLLTDSVSFTGEYTAKRRNGNTFTVIISAFPLINDGKISGLRGTVVDISERKRAEQSLEQKNKDLQFLSSLAFELAELPSSENLTEYLINKLKDYTGATFIASSDYDPETHTLIMNQFKTEKKILNRVIRKFGKKAIYTPAPITDQIYNQMLQEIIGIRHSLTEISFGLIPESIDKTVKSITGIDCYYGISITVSGELIGAFMLAFKTGQNLPQKELMVSVGHLAAITLRRYNAEKALKISEERFRKSFITSPDCITINRLNDGVYISINEGFTSMTGYRDEDIIGKATTEITIFADMSERERLVDDLKRSAVVQNREIKFKRKNGSIVTGLVSASILDFNGVLHILSITRDIEEIKKTQIALKESEERFKQVAENAEEWIWEVDSEGLYTYSSPIIEKILGYKPVEIVGIKHFYDFFPSESVDKLKTAVLEVFSRKGRIDKLINENISKDGHKVYLETTGAPILDKTGFLIGYRGTDTDVTERLLGEEKLRKLSLAVEQSPASIIITNLNGEIEYVNQRFTQLTGYLYDEVIGKNPSILKSGKTNKEEYQNLWSNITSGKEWRGEFYNKKKNGNFFWESASISPIMNNNGEITHYLCVKEDITEKKEATNYIIDKIIQTEERERLRYSNELHDGLGPIISTIKLYFQLLEENIDPDQKRLIIERASNCIEEAIQTLKEISHNLSPNVVNNFGLVAGLQNFISRFNETEVFFIDFDFNIDRRYESNVEITFYRIITELINNTLKYANASHVSIKLNYSDAASILTLVYTDNGKGFDLEKAMSKGRGLGLASIYQRMNALNGKINIETGIGKGVKVDLELPIIK